MLKTFTLAFICLFIIKTVNGQSQDTLKFYYQNGNIPIASIDGADYFRIIYPPDPGDNLKNVREYYKNGKIKFVGKFDTTLNRGYLGGSIRYSGACTSYYPNGKKESVNQYVDGYKDGVQYLYYPGGQIYCTMKYVARVAGLAPREVKWECYDVNGAQLCQNGNGQWINYDPDYKSITLGGPVKKGEMDGEWHGIVPDVDSIRYTLNYSNGVFKSGIGYDKAGRAYPFTKERENARYRLGIIDFIKIFKSRLHLPKNSDGTKMSFDDSVLIFFTIEKDGHTTNFGTLGNVSPELKDALEEAMSKCQDWLPGRFYGIPYRAKLTLPLKFIHGYTSETLYTEQTFYNIELLGF